MPGATLDLTVVCARDFYLSITNQTAAGKPFAIVNYVAVMTVKTSIDDPDANALYQGGPWATDYGFGKLTFKLAHDLTGSWWPPGSGGPVSTAVVYDVAYADAATPERNWNTILSGAVHLEQPVTVVIPGG
jgi:hypothetical protein